MLEPALLLLVLFGPLAFGSVEPWSRAVLQAGAFLLPLLKDARGQRPALSLPWTALAAIGALLVVGAFQALNPAPFQGPLPWLPFSASAWHTKKELLQWAAYAVLLAAASHGSPDDRSCRRFAWAVVLVGVAVSAIGLIQASHGNLRIMGFREVPYGVSPFGPYYNNGHAASLMAVSTFMGLGLLASGLSRVVDLSRRGAPIVDELAVQALLAFFMGITVVGWVSTLNRGSLLAFWAAAVCVSVIACGRIEKPARRWGTRAVLLLALFGAGALAVRFGALSRGAQSSVPVRLSMYRGALSLLADAPVWGTGLGTVIAVFGPYKAPHVEGIVDHVHSDWLELPLQAGVPVAALMLAALLAFARRVRRGWLQEPAFERWLLVGGGAGAAMCFVFHAAVEFTWHIPANAVVILLLMGWLWRHGADKSAVARPRAASGPVVAGVLVLLAMAATRQAVGWILMKSARYEAAYAWDADPKYLEMARRLDALR